MVQIYGHKWGSAYGEAAEIDGEMTGTASTWAQGLAGVETRRIAKGLEACIVSADPWPPTLPAFRAMCLDVPSLFRVEQAIRDGESDPFIAEVRRKIDSHLYKTADAARAAKMVQKAYELARDMVMSGGELPPVVEMIEHKESPPEPVSEDNRDRIAAQMKQLGRLYG